MQYIYGAVFLLSLTLLPLYFALVRKKQEEIWLLVLCVCVSIVNLGYTMIAFSSSVEFALFANKVSYLGQVMMPLCMFMIISKLCGYRCGKWLVCTLIGVAAIMFAIVCTAGYLDWYYTDATIENVAGATVLQKEYGVLHPHQPHLRYPLFPRYDRSALCIARHSQERILEARVYNARRSARKRRYLVRTEGYPMGF